LVRAILHCCYMTPRRQYVTSAYFQNGDSGKEKERQKYGVGQRADAYSG